MSWYNPTPEEASEEYSYYKHRYSDAAAQRSASMRLEDSYVSERNAANSQLSSLSSQKLNFEKRLEGIDNIIKMLEGTGGWFSTNVPSTITKAVSSIQKTDASYHQSIRMTGGTAAASLATAFRTKTVDEDANSASALQGYKTERAKLEQNIIDLNNQIASLSGMISSLNGKINACNADQASLQRTMNESAYVMNHYKRYMY